MFQFLCKFVPFPRHIAITTSVFPGKLGSVCFRNPFFYVKFISTASNEESFTISYLVSNCGISSERAISISKYLHLKSRENPDLVIEFLQNQGFSHAQALIAIGTCPGLLRLDPEKIFLPKIKFLKSKGVLSSDIPGIILSDPNILMRSLDKHIIPSYDFLSSLLKSDKNFVKALKRSTGILVSLNKYVMPNINLLRAEGVAESNIIKIIEQQPRTLIRQPHKFKVAVEELKEMGFDPQKFSFVQALWALTSISKFTRARKFAAFKRWDWTEDEIRKAFGRFPTCMMISEKMIEAKMEFFVNKLGCKSSSIARRPLLLGLSLDKRIIPRNAVIQVLLSKGLVTKLKLSPMFECSERVFMERYILHHEKEADELLKLYHAKLELPGVDLKAEQLQGL